MSFPMGNRFTVSMFLAWVLSHGYRVSSGYAVKVNGKMKPLTKIVSPDGQHHVIIPNGQSSPMPLSEIHSKCRRLDLNADDFLFATQQSTHESKNPETPPI